MKMMLFASLVCLFSIAAFAQEVQLTAAERMLEADLLNAKGGVVSISKPLRLYHYLNAPMQGSELWPTYQTPELRYSPNGQVASDLSLAAGAFWNLDNHMVKLVNGGPGMYLANEPVISANYGHSNYALTFPSGTKYIDVSDPTWKHVSNIKLSKATVAALISEHIIRSSDVRTLGMQNGYFTRLSMQNIASVGLETYRETISKIFEKNRIALVQYTWEKTKLSLICKKGSASAFVFIGGRPEGSQRPTQDSSVRATISSEILENAVFMSQHPIAEQTPEELSVIQDTDLLKSILKTGNTKLASKEKLAEIKNLHFNCE